MRSASARAWSSTLPAWARAASADAARMPFADGPGGGWSKLKESVASEPATAAASTSDHLLVVLVVLAAADHDRAGLLEAAHHRDDAALRLLHHAAPLRRLQVHVLLQHLAAALGHVGEDLL